MFVVTQVRQALQQTVAIGAFSPYFPAACATRPVHIVFIALTLVVFKVLDPCTRTMSSAKVCAPRRRWGENGVRT
jgi:hypothetical protein